jgi:AraC-like DNA-binding protein
MIVDVQRILRHRRLVIGATVVAFAAAGGGAYAATQSSSANPQQAFLNDVAKRLHVSPQKLTAAIKGAMSDRLNAAVKAGRLTPAQAKALKQHLAQKGGPPFVPPFFAAPFLFGPPGHGGLQVPRAVGPGGFPGPPPLFLGPSAGAASYLGLSQQQLFDQLRSGRSLAQIAKARGKSVSGLEKAMTASIKSRLDKLVSAGHISKSQEQKMLAMLSSAIHAMVNGSPRFRILPGGPPGPWFQGAKPPPGQWRAFKAPGSAYAPAPGAFAVPGA